MYDVVVVVRLVVMTMVMARFVGMVMTMVKMLILLMTVVKTTVLAMMMTMMINRRERVLPGQDAVSTAV